MPTAPHAGSGCGIPKSVDPKIYGDNSNSRGLLGILPGKSGLEFDIRLFNLSRPDHVMTAWIFWANPFSTNLPPIFQVADVASPCAPFTAGFPTGLGREPNEFVYQSATEARLKVRLNFNPTFPGEGALVRRVGCFQKDVPKIKGTRFEQFPIPRGYKTVFVPTSNNFLRKYDPETGFEVLNANKRPKVVRSPVKALFIDVVSHLDKTTHGISPGAFMVDHYSLMTFPLDIVQIGNKTV